MYQQQGQQQQQAQSPHQMQPQNPWDQNVQQQHDYRGHPQQPPNGAYPPPPNSQHHGPPQGHLPSHIRPDRPEMASVHPHYPPQQEMYRLPAPSSLPSFYQPGPPQDYRHQQQQVGTMTQSAPRQRTAIACKYCRRRKIRCSGFENSEDGRCTNCVRFSQECIFTPISAQTQAFVPAQAIYGPNARARPGGVPEQLYGSYGQPLPRQPQYAQQPPPGYGPPPTGPYQGQPGQPYGQTMYPPPPQQNDPQQVPENRRRHHDEPHTPTLPPPNPGPTSQLANHREGDPHTQPGAPPAQFAYPEPAGYSNGAVSPASSTTSYNSHPQPYYGPQQPRRASPNSVYSFEHAAQRASISPQTQQAPYNYAPQQPTPQPSVAATPTPAPSATAADSCKTTPHAASSSIDNTPGKNALSIRDIVTDSKGKSTTNSTGTTNGQPERSAADIDMVSALNRTSRR